MTEHCVSLRLVFQASRKTAEERRGSVRVIRVIRGFRPSVFRHLELHPLIHY